VTHVSIRSASFALASFLVGVAAMAAEDEQTREREVVGTFIELGDRLKVGETIYVTDNSGRVIKGRIQRFSRETPALILEKPERLFDDPKGTSGRKLDGPFTVGEADARRIEVEVGDSRKDGALIGLAVGATPGLLALAFGDSEVRAFAGYTTVFWGGIFAAAGALIDSRTKSRQPIYSVPAREPSLKVRWSPILSPDRKGVSFSVEF